MMTKFVISFAIGLGVYFIGLLILVLVKRYKNKKRLEKELKEHESEVNSNETKE